MAPVSYSSTFESHSFESTSTPEGTSSRVVYSNPGGTTVTTTNQPAGEGVTSETRTYPAGGSLEGNSQGRIEDVTDRNGGDGRLSKEEADRLYEERMEDEYAKREGGA